MVFVAIIGKVTRSLSQAKNIASQKRKPSLWKDTTVG